MLGSWGIMVNRDALPFSVGYNLTSPQRVSRAFHGATTCCDGHPINLVQLENCTVQQSLKKYFGDWAVHQIKCFCIIVYTACVLKALACKLAGGAKSGLAGNYQIVLNASKSNTGNQKSYKQDCVLGVEFCPLRSESAIEMEKHTVACEVSHGPVHPVPAGCAAWP